jgi:CDP-diacylglycerol--glycerol-3-phosphate 3-phosphatidyltransferase
MKLKIKRDRKLLRAERARRLWASAFNLPNQLTFLRLILAVVMFCLISWELYLASFVLFVIAAGTDWLDGYFARKYGQVTTLGRILDPFADKVIVCGTFIFLVSVPALHEVSWGVRPWMVVVIVGRELLVTALRSFLEDQGADFSAKISGKLKMVLQCIAAGACLVYLDCLERSANAPLWVRWSMIGSVWAAVLLTIYSGLAYIVVASRLVRSSR